MTQTTSTRTPDELVIDPQETGAVVLDVEDVVLRLAPLRREAWRRVVEDALQRAGGESGVASAELDNLLAHGASDDAIREILAARGVSVPEGASHDPPEQLTTWGLKNLAEVELLGLMEQRGVKALPTEGTVRRLHQAGIKLVAYSEDKVRLALWLLGLERLFVAVLDASAAEWLDLPRQPAPDALVLASEIAAVELEETALITTTPELAAAGCRAGLGLVVGLSPTSSGASLIRSGADVVLNNLEQVVPAESS
jgi:phosphoglycolate phosphatase-like HAD superfamily hydrolase